MHFLMKQSAPENFQCENFSKGVPAKSLRTHGRYRICVLKGSATHFCPCRERAAKLDLPAKLGWCYKKRFERSFCTSGGQVAGGQVTGAGVTKKIGKWGIPEKSIQNVAQLR